MKNMYRSPAFMFNARQSHKRSIPLIFSRIIRYILFDISKCLLRIIFDISFTEMINIVIFLSEKLF